MTWLPSPRLPVRPSSRLLFIPQSEIRIPQSSQRLYDAAEEEDEYERADGEAVGNEDGCGVRSQVSKEEPDGGVADEAGDDGCDEELCAVAVREFVQRLLQFEQAARADRGDGEQERETRGGLALLAREEAAHDGRA